MSVIEEKNLEDKFIKVARFLTRARPDAEIPEEIVGILKIAIGKENVDFITAFEEKNSFTMGELKENLK
ncbi:MAG: hypothetical protein ACFFD7_10300, partial [Candidatus Thorarchaeota archaeon]